MIKLAAALALLIPQEDLSFVNGTVYTQDPAAPTVQAVALRNGVVFRTGTTDEIRALGGRIIDLQGATVVPGLVDAHGHVASLGSLVRRVDLRDTKSFEEVVERVRERAKTIPRGEWIIGRGWNQESWKDATLPTHEKLSEATPDHPVWLSRVDGHAGLANRRAMELARVSARTPSPPGGEILKNDKGEPTGIFVDNAMGHVTAHLPGSTRESIKQQILDAQQACLKAGLTGVHDAGCGSEYIRAYEELAAEGKLKMRFYVMVSGSTAWTIDYISKNPLRVGRGANLLTIRSIKMMADGALGSRGALLLEPYEDRPKDDQGRPYHGLSTIDTAALRKVGVEALRRGWQLCVHAIGDRGNREVLDGFEAALKEVPVRDHRFRVEHAQITHPDDIKRFAALGVVPSMQPTHATSDMWMAEKRLGKRRLDGAYAWQKFLKSGSIVASGSDFPVESEKPLWGLYAAVTRQDHEGRPEGGWLPEERMSREEALSSFTLGACHASFEADWKGRLARGWAADLVVLSKDIMKVTPAEMLKTEVLYTVVAGQIGYEK
jgi:predicted amidohydrolase YtcJ